jgi:TonB dependent receptor/Carboxypeptidase regulatory-like domain/TonB-dependent Receptor Plug Domain
MRKAYVFLLAAALLVFEQPVRATVFGGVRGVVHDPQHRPIPGAQVQLKSATSDWSQPTQTNQDGEFEFATVPIGDYIVTASASGFQNLQQRITVTADSSAVLHFPLAIASVSQTATVSAQAPVGNVDSATSTTLLDRSDIALTPGADRSNSLAMITDFVPAAYLTHDQLHVRGGHQVSWLIDGVPIPNTNIASNVGPQFDPKDIDYLEVERGSYEADTGDRTYGVFNVVPRNGFERNNEAQLITSFGNFYQTNDEFNLGGHTPRFAYYASVNGNRSNLGLETPVSQIHHDAENGVGGFGSLIFNATPKDQLRFVTSLRRDYYQIPYDPNPNDSENQEFQTSGLRDGQHETDDFVVFSWVRTFNPNAILTISPFYHFNRANYGGSPNDTPVQTTDNRSSNYTGGQATLALTLPKNNLQVGTYTFAEHESEFFGLLLNPLPTPAPPVNPITDSEASSGALEAFFLSDKFTVTPWLTLIGGFRATHFSGSITENTIDPRLGAALRVPYLHWVFRAYYGRYYQAPPLVTITGPLLSEINGLGGLAFTPLHGERDEEHQFGVTIPIRGWSLDIDDFETHARNFFDHNNIGESNVFIPVTIAEARIRGLEVTVRSPRLWDRGQVHLAYSNQTAQAAGAITGGLICFPPTDPSCLPEPGFSALDHDQRNTLNVGFDANLPWQLFGAANVYYGSGFTNGSPDAQFPDAYLPGHAAIDLSLRKDLGERFSVAVNALNIADRHLLIDNSLTFGGFHYNDPREVYVEVRYKFHY